MDNQKLVLSICPLPLNHEIMEKASKYRFGAKVSTQVSHTSRDVELNNSTVCLSLDLLCSLHKYFSWSMSP